MPGRLLDILLLGLVLVSSDCTSEASHQPEGVTIVSETWNNKLVHVIKTEAGSVDWNFLVAAKGKTLSRAKLTEIAPRAIVITNGNYFKEDLTPMGLMVDEGKTINEMRKADWGVFRLSNDRRASIVHRKNHSPRDRTNTEFAIESGPRLVVDGRAIKTRPGLARRTAIGICPDNSVILAVFESSVHLKDVSSYMLERWKVKDAINLDGGSSSQLYLRDKERLKNVVWGIEVPVMIELVPALKD